MGAMVEEDALSRGSCRREKGSDERSHHILFIDAYDSFTCNITALLRNTLNVKVHVVHMDLKSFQSDQPPWFKEQFRKRLRCYDAVVCGPGPGSPLNPSDVGVFQDIWDAAYEEMIPTLGICLGFQSLVATFGGKIRKLKRGLHGMVREIGVAQSDIFKGVSPFKATLYHSLCADIGQDDISEDLWQTQARWTPTEDAPDLVPLAWVTEIRDGVPERILMAVKHRQRPFWDIQYHPESVCTDAAATDAVLRNWFAGVRTWNKSSRRKESFNADHPNFPVQYELKDQNDTLKYFFLHKFGTMGFGLGNDQYSFGQLQIPPGVDTADIAEILQQGDCGTVMLDSSSAGKRDPLAKTSIIALDADNAPRFEYRAKDNHLLLRHGNNVSKVGYSQGPTAPRRFIWHALAGYQLLQYGFDEIEAPAACKFRGGFMGYLTYEMGLNALSAEEVPQRPECSSRPDLCMAWVQKSVVVDHATSTLYVQTLSTAEAGPSWVQSTIQTLQSSPVWSAARSQGPVGVAQALPDLRPGNGNVQIEKPKVQEYESKVRLCQESIAEGDSYELCLTAQTTMLRPKCTSSPRYKRLEADVSAADMKPTSPWDIYKVLRKRQPAPFGSFIRLGSATLLSSSPERFLSNNGKGLCEMRPMKGTVRKSQEVSTLAQAERLLHIPKEEAENLMIVDLVRHDLHSICGPHGVTVPELLKVEEYESVFTMITVVNGQYASRKPDELRTSAFDILDAVFPPGSMTGAPKKRSCEILRGLEKTERMLYSGVVGYIDVMGQSDWSVTIRSMFRYDDEVNDNDNNGDEVQPNPPQERWHIGAGGAVTILSTPEGECEEMMTKLAGPLGVFCDAA